MASLVDTLTQNLRSRYSGRLDANESRPSEYGALDLFNKQSRDKMGILSPQLKTNIENSFGQKIEEMVIDFDAPTISDVRTCEVQTGGVTSHMVPFTFFTLSFGVAMVPSRFLNNDIAYADAWTRLIDDRINASMALLDGRCVDNLNTNKNRYFPADILSYYPQLANALQVAAEPNSLGRKDWNELYNNLTSILATQDFGGVPDILTNPRGMATVRNLASQGAYNAENMSWLVDLVGEFYQSNRVLNNSGVAATEYAVLPRSVAIAGRLDPDCRVGRNIGGPDSPSKQWTKTVLPRIGEMGLYFRADCSDESARLSAERGTGLTRAYVESYEFSKDFVIFGAYNSNPLTRYQPVTKFELLQA
jgi:hypothetical protein